MLADYSRRRAASVTVARNVPAAISPSSPTHACPFMLDAEPSPAPGRTPGPGFGWLIPSTVRTPVGVLAGAVVSPMTVRVPTTVCVGSVGVLVRVAVRVGV